jgi:predicted nucleotidyltransferase
MYTRKISNKVQSEINNYIEALQNDRITISDVYLYGSYAKGTSNKWSDIDLCIVSPDFEDTYVATQYLWKKRLKDFDLTIEPIAFTPQDFNSSYSPLVGEIKKTGIKIL